MLFYIDYLDQITSGNYPFQTLELRFRYDLLVFGRDTLCMSVPACIKLEQTALLLMKLDEFWKSGKILLQLDRKHRGRAENYFANRKKVLAKGMPEEKLVKHFEFVAYESNRTRTFFGVYMPEVVSVSPNVLYINKLHDTDALFRSETQNQFLSHTNEICSDLEVTRAINFVGMANTIQSFALDRSTLFQRALIEDKIVDQYNPNSNEKNITATLLDRAFALANAETSNAYPISLIKNQLTGRWLAHLLYKSYRELYNAINELSWSEIFSLSQNEDWQKLITCINAYISVAQDAKEKKYELPIENYINGLSHSLYVLALVKLIRNEAIDAAKEKMYQIGLFSGAQDIEMVAELLADAYSGKYRMLFDVLCAIDYYSSKVLEELTKEKKYRYLVDDSISRENRNFDILR